MMNKSLRTLSFYSDLLMESWEDDTSTDRLRGILKSFVADVLVRYRDVFDSFTTRHLDDWHLEYDAKIWRYIAIPEYAINKLSDKAHEIANNYIADMADIYTRDLEQSDWVDYATFVGSRSGHLAVVPDHSEYWEYLVAGDRDPNDNIDQYVDDILDQMRTYGYSGADFINKVEHVFGSAQKFGRQFIKDLENLAGEISSDEFWKQYMTTESSLKMSFDVTPAQTAKTTSIKLGFETIPPLANMDNFIDWARNLIDWDAFVQHVVAGGKLRTVFILSLPTVPADESADNIVGFTAILSPGGDHWRGRMTTQQLDNMVGDHDDGHFMARLADRLTVELPQNIRAKWVPLVGGTHHTIEIHYVGPKHSAVKLGFETTPPLDRGIDGMAKWVVSHLDLDDWFQYLDKAGSRTVVSINNFANEINFFIRANPTHSRDKQYSTIVAPDVFRDTTGYGSDVGGVRRYTTDLAQAIENVITIDTNLPFIIRPLFPGSDWSNIIKIELDHGRMSAAKKKLSFDVNQVVGNTIVDMAHNFAEKYDFASIARDLKQKIHNVAAPQLGLFESGPVDDPTVEWHPDDGEFEARQYLATVDVIKSILTFELDSLENLMDDIFEYESRDNIAIDVMELAASLHDMGVDTDHYPDVVLTLRHDPRETETSIKMSFQPRVPMESPWEFVNWLYDTVPWDHVVKYVTGPADDTGYPRTSNISTVRLIHNKALRVDRGILGTMPPMGWSLDVPLDQLPHDIANTIKQDNSLYIMQDYFDDVRVYLDDMIKQWGVRTHVIVDATEVNIRIFSP